MPQPSIAELTEEFVALNQLVKDNAASEAQIGRWDEVRHMLLVAQRQPVPEPPRDGEAQVRSGG